MLKVYGADICKDCLVMKKVFSEQEVEYEYVSITDNTANLRAFLAIRDTDPLYEGLRAGGGGGIGIPLFVLDSDMTFDMNKVLESLGKPLIGEEEYDELVKECWEEYCNSK